MSPQCLPPSLSSIRLTVWEQMSFQDFQDGHHGGHLGYRNGKNLAILNLQVTEMPPTKFRFNPTSRSGAEVVWRFSRWLSWWPSWISERNDFSHSESLCCSDARLPSSFSSNRLRVWEEMSFEDFQDGQHGGHVAYQNGMILAILNLHVAPMPSTKFGLDLTWGLGADVVSRFSRWPPRRPSWLAEQNDFSNSDSLCFSNASQQVSAQSNLRFGRRCRLKTFKMSAMAALLDIGMKRF